MSLLPVYHIYISNKKSSDSGARIFVFIKIEKSFDNYLKFCIKILGHW